MTDSLQEHWRRLAPRLLPFADVGSAELPLSRILRLALFQVSVGMALVLITGTLNRVMIVELGVSAWFVALMVALPVLFAPLRALIGFRSDTHRSALGWRRVPFVWFGSMLQFGGLAIMPFALLVMTGDGHGPAIYGQLGAGLAFLLVGAGLHTTQTAGLALACDIATPERRPRVVALLFVMLLVGMIVSALLFGWLLRDFSATRLIRVIQSAALATLVLNTIAMWRQEPRHVGQLDERTPAATFSDAWRSLRDDPRAVRLLVAVALGTAGFTMQDILLEPFGGEILDLPVSATTGLTALLASGMLLAFALSAKRLGGNVDAHRLAAYGALVGIVAFVLVAMVSMFELVALFALGVLLIGFGGGLFAVGTLTAAMGLAHSGNSGIALGAWGAVQATASGIAIAGGGALRDLFSEVAASGVLGPLVAGPGAGYAFVYYLEVLLLFATLAAIGPLAAFTRQNSSGRTSRFGLAEFPG